MADFVSTSSPDILWRIRNYSTPEYKSFPASFFGLHWKLQFVPYTGSNVRMISIFLKLLNVPENFQTLQLSVNTCILAEDGSRHSCPDKTEEITLKEGRWILWWENLSNVEKITGTAPDVCFWIRISHRGNFEQQMLSREQIKQQAKEEKVSCIKRHEKSLTENLSTLYISSEHSDFELRCKGWSKPVHKSILSARCGYFAALFRSPMKESDEKYVEFHDIEPDTLQHVIHYLYTGNFPESALHSVRDIYAVADRFDFEPLKVQCASLMMDNFVKEHQTNMENEDLNQDRENLHNSHDDYRKKLLKKLFKTKEWNVLFEEYPDLAEKMCKPVIFEFS